MHEVSLVSSGLLPLYDICCHDSLPETEHVWIMRIDSNLEPMMVGATERLDTREVFKRRKVRRTCALHSLWPEGFVNSEVVAVAVDQNDGFAERYRLLLKQHTDIGKSIRVFFGRPSRWRVCGKYVRLLHNHYGSTLAGLCVLECLLKPRKIGHIALHIFGIAVGRAPKTVVVPGMCRVTKVTPPESHRTFSRYFA